MHMHNFRAVYQIRPRGVSDTQQVYEQTICSQLFNNCEQIAIDLFTIELEIQFVLRRSRTQFSSVVEICFLEAMRGIHGSLQGSRILLEPIVCIVQGVLVLYKLLFML